jgi:cobalamin biosynthesis protein CobT
MSYEEDYYEEDYNDNYDGGDDGDRYDEDEHSKSSEGEISDEGEENYSGEEEEDENVGGEGDPSDYGRGGGGGNYQGDKFRFRSIRDVMLGRMYGILSGHLYFEFTEDDKADAVNIVEKIPEKKVILYNVDVLVPVALYMAIYNKNVSAKNIEEFIKKMAGLKTVNHLDFIRYIRILQKLNEDGFLS